MNTYNELRIAAIAAARSHIDRAVFLASLLPADRSDSALVYDRCREYDQPQQVDFTDEMIGRACAELYQIRTLAAIAAATDDLNSGYRDLSYRVLIGARLSPGMQRAISRLHVVAPTVAEAIEYLKKSETEHCQYIQQRYGL